MEDATPRRLHPATTVIAVLRGAPSTLLGVPALLAVVARADLWLVLLGALIAFAVAAGARWLAWTRFTYELTDDAVVIESGLLSRNRRTIPFERIADVGIERRPLQRLFGLAAVTLETGGAGADDGTLDSVAVSEAERLRDVVRRRASAVGPRPVPARDAGRTASAAAPIFTMSPGRVLLWGLHNFSLVWIAVGFGALQSFGGVLGIDRDVLWDAVVDRSDTARALSFVAWARTVVTVAAVVLAIGVVAGVIRTGLREWGFRLTAEPGRLRRARGLFTRSEAVVSLPRIQLAAIDTGPIRRWLGWSRLRAQLLGGEGAGGRQDLAPFARAPEVDRLLQLLQLERTDVAGMTSVARGHVWRALLRRVAFPVLVIAGAAAVTPLAFLAMPLLLPLIVVALLDRRHHRYRVTAGRLHVQRGVLGRTTFILPVSKAQVVTLRQSWLQRRLGLATVLVDTAGGGMFGGPDVHDLREADGWALIADLRAPGQSFTAGVECLPVH